MTAKKAIVIQVSNVLQQGIELAIAFHFGIEASTITNKGENESLLTYQLDEQQEQEYYQKFLTYLQEQEQRHLLKLIPPVTMEFTQEDLYVLATGLEGVMVSCGSDSEWRSAFLERASALHSRIEELSDKSVNFTTLLAQAKNEEEG